MSGQILILLFLVLSGITLPAYVSASGINVLKGPELLATVNAIRKSLGSNNVQELVQAKSPGPADKASEALTKTCAALEPTYVKADKQVRFAFSRRKLISTNKEAADEIKAEYNGAESAYDPDTGKCATGAAANPAKCKIVKAFTYYKFDEVAVYYTKDCTNGTGNSTIGIVFTTADTDVLSAPDPYSKGSKCACASGYFCDPEEKICRKGTPIVSDKVWSTMNSLRGSLKGVNINFLDKGDNTVESINNYCKVEAVGCLSVPPTIKNNIFCVTKLEDGSLTEDQVVTKVRAFWDSQKSGYNEKTGKCNTASSDKEKCKIFKGLSYHGYAKVAGCYNECGGGSGGNKKTLFALCFQVGKAEILTNDFPYRKCLCETGRFCDEGRSLCILNPSSSPAFVTELNSLRGSLNATNIHELSPNPSIDAKAQVLAQDCDAPSIKSENGMNIVTLLEPGYLDTGEVKNKIEALFKEAKKSYNPTTGQCTGSDANKCKIFKALSYSGYDSASVAFNKRCEGTKTAIILVFPGGDKSQLENAFPYKTTPDAGCKSGWIYNNSKNLCVVEIRTTTVTTIRSKGSQLISSCWIIIIGVIVTLFRM